MPDSLTGDESAELDAPRSWGLVSLVCLLALAAGPPVYFSVGAHVAPRIILAGAATWGVAVAAKHPLALLLNRTVGRTRQPGLLGTLQGLLSAVLELGAAGAYVHYLPDDFTSLVAVLAFGSAAGSAEVVYLLATGIRSGSDPAKLADWQRSAMHSVCVRYQVPLERAFALVGHTGARGMVYLGMQLPGVAGIGFGLAAVTMFSAIDAVAYYGHLRQWNWFDAGVCRRVHAFFSTVSVLELILFFAGFRMLHQT